MRARLALRREVLTVVAGSDLAAVGGGALPTVPVNVCIPEVTSRAVECDSLLRACVTSTCER